MERNKLLNIGIFMDLFLYTYLKDFALLCHSDKILSRFVLLPILDLRCLYPLQRRTCAGAAVPLLECELLREAAEPPPIAASSLMPDASPLMPRLNQTLLSLVTHHTESVPTETCTIFKPFVASQPLTGVGGLTSSQASPAKFSRVTPERTMTRPLYKTAQTNPVGPTLNCVSSLPAGVEIAVQRKPSGEELLTPVRNMA
ncbi:hypothetical protein GQX74_002783 [Glossina fuscipes]|nr:hypothetical protein GQX74_002783 [Glossina fuscipes]